MTTTEQAPIREIVCSNCGEPLGDYSRTERTKVGRCCFNLPAPWDKPGEESDDEEESDECDCWDCRQDAGTLDVYDFVSTGRTIDDFTNYTQDYQWREPNDFEIREFNRLSS